MTSLRDWSPRKERVLFRKYPDGELVALFPDTPIYQDKRRTYTAFGRHSGMDPDQLLAETRPAEPAEYIALLEELLGIGYNLDVRGLELGSVPWLTPKKV